MRRFRCGDHVDRSQLGQCVANRMINDPQTGLASFDMNDWDPHGHGGNGGGKHLKAIGCDQGDVRSQLGKALGKAQLGTSSRGGHVHIAVSAQAGNSMQDFVAFGFNFSNGRAVVMVYHRGRGHQDGFQF